MYIEDLKLRCVIIISNQRGTLFSFFFIPKFNIFSNSICVFLPADQLTMPCQKEKPFETKEAWWIGEMVGVDERRGWFTELLTFHLCSTMSSTFLFKKPNIFFTSSRRPFKLGSSSRLWNDFFYSGWRRKTIYLPASYGKQNVFNLEDKFAEFSLHVNIKQNCQWDPL